jgi:hypothetical protein
VRKADTVERRQGRIRERRLAVNEARRHRSRRGARLVTRVLGDCFGDGETGFVWSGAHANYLVCFM